MKYDAVVFDLFGTLVDNWSAKENQQLVADMAVALGGAGEEFNRRWEETRDERLKWGHGGPLDSMGWVSQGLSDRVPPDRINQAAQIHLEFIKNRLTPRADAVETLAQLKAAGYKVGLITDCYADVSLLWAETVLAQVVDAPVFSCDEGIKKPDARIYQLACDRLGVAPSGCLYVGDGGSNELSGASSFGMSAVQIRVPYKDDWAEAQAEEWHGPTVATLSDLLSLVN